MADPIDHHAETDAAGAGGGGGGAKDAARDGADVRAAGKDAAPDGTQSEPPPAGSSQIDARLEPPDAEVAVDSGPGHDAAPADRAIPKDTAPAPDAAPAGNCKQSGVLYCEDFESDLPAFWDQISFNGIIARDQSRAYRGHASFHANVNVVPTKTAWARLSETMTIPEPDRYMRSFVYLPKASAMNDMVFMMTDDPKGYSAIGLGFTAGKMEIWSWGDSAAKAGDPALFPTDRWVCVEWHLHHAGNQSTMDVWRDGQAVVTAAAVTNKGTLPAMWAGIYSNSDNQAGTADVWYDDVAIDSKPIGCTK